ncbi:MAG: nicotinate-nucleotide adenylyltransferase [Synergistaceae bacterium]|nr:nicotinate-nucleotide adenylyltransferase [Synergistaceae bacterium]
MNNNLKRGETKKTKKIKKRIGLMGGTFDPIHFGHLLAAEESHRELELDDVIFVPTGEPPHKRGVSDKEHRYDMTLLATAGIPYFSVSRMEIDREKSTHTIDTLREFRAIMGEDAEFCFITGLDAILSISTWKEYLKLPELCRLVTVTRPGYSPENLDELPAGIREEIIFIEIPRFSLSSTNIRERISEGKGAKYLVPDAVEDYIRKCKLYLYN